MLGIGRPDRHALPHITPSKRDRPRQPLPPARAGSFFGVEAPSDKQQRSVGSPPHLGRSIYPLRRAASGHDRGSSVRQPTLCAPRCSDAADPAHSARRRGGFEQGSFEALHFRVFKVRLVSGSSGLGFHRSPRRRSLAICRRTRKTRLPTSRSVVRL